MLNIELVEIVEVFSNDRYKVVASDKLKLFKP